MAKQLHPVRIPEGGMTFPENESEAVVIAEPEAKMEALAIPSRAQALVVQDQGGLDAAKSFLSDIDAVMGRINDSFDPQISQAHKLHKSLLAEKAKFTAPLEDAKRIVGRKAADFVAAQEAERREAERKRLAAEDEARKEAEKAVAKAGKLEADGKGQAAAAIVNLASKKVDDIMSAAPEVPDKPDTSGLTVREDWKFSIVDPSKIPPEYLMPDEKKIGRTVRNLKDQAIIPGVRVWAEKGVATRAPREFSERI